MNFLTHWSSEALSKNLCRFRSVETSHKLNRYVLYNLSLWVPVIAVTRCLRQSRSPNSQCVSIPNFTTPFLGEHLSLGYLRVGFQLIIFTSQLNRYISYNMSSFHALWLWFMASVQNWEKFFKSQLLMVWPITLTIRTKVIPSLGSWFPCSSKLFSFPIARVDWSGTKLGKEEAWAAASVPLLQPYPWNKP